MFSFRALFKQKPVIEKTASDYHALIDTRLSHVRMAFGPRRAKNALQGYIANGYQPSATYDCEDVDSAQHIHRTHDACSYVRLGFDDLVYIYGGGIGRITDNETLTTITPYPHSQVSDTALLQRIYEALYEFVI